MAPDGRPRIYYFIGPVDEKKNVKTVIIIRSSVKIYHFCSLVLTNFCDFDDPRTISRFLMWPSKKINW